MQEQDLHILAPPGMIHLPGWGLGGGLLGVTGAAATEDPAVLGGGSGVTEPQSGACN